MTKVPVHFFNTDAAAAAIDKKGGEIMRRFRKQIAALLLAVCLLPLDSVMAATKTIGIIVQQNHGVMVGKNKVVPIPWDNDKMSYYRAAQEKMHPMKGTARLLKKTGTYKVKVRYKNMDVADDHERAVIIFQAPKAGIYTIRFSGLHSSCKDDSGTFMGVSVGLLALDGKPIELENYKRLVHFVEKETENASSFVSKAFLKAQKENVRDSMDRWTKAYLDPELDVDDIEYQEKMKELREGLESMGETYPTELSAKVWMKKGEYFIAGLSNLADVDKDKNGGTLNTLSFNMKITLPVVKK